MDRYGQRLDQEDSYIYQFSTRSGAFLDILSPPNEAVGKYLLEVTAKDTAGLSSSTRLPIEIKNTNDEPMINRDSENKIRALFSSISTEETALEEGDRFLIPYTKLFSDDDYLLGGMVDERLNIKLETKDGNKLEYVDINSTTRGDIELVYEPPRGIVSYIKNEFRFVASDKTGESVSTDWFTTYIKPTAQLINLTSGENQESISQENAYFEANKNLEFDIAKTLELNSIELTDPVGDNVYLMISLPYRSSMITIDGEENSKVISKTTTTEGAHFKLSINELSKIPDRVPGDLSGLMLNLPVNKMMMIPNHKGKEASGIPLEIWTEASVASEVNNERFDLMKTEPVTAWIKLNNKSPRFNSTNIITIQRDEVRNERVLLSLDDLFTDADNNDSKTFEILPSDEIKDFIVLDTNSNELKLSDLKQKIDKLPDGLHKIGIRMKDSSGFIGDRSGFASGQIRLLVKSKTDDTETVSGLNLLSTIDETGISQILEISNDQLDNDQIQLKSILQELSVIPDIQQGNEFSAEDIQNATKFISQIQRGSAAVLRNDDIKSEGLLVLESEDEDNILINSQLICQVQIF